MATSGSIDYALTAKEIITFALRKINITAQTEEPSADDASRALTELNLMLKGWQRYEHLWRVTEGSITLTDATASYAPSPRPYRVYSMRYRDANSLDTEMVPLTHMDYFNLPDKTASGVPTQWYFDPQRDTDTIYVWPVLATVNTTTAETLRLTYQRRFEDVDTLTENVDIPQQYLEIVGMSLASRLADSYGRTGNHIDRIIARAQDLKNEMLDDDREDFIQFAPDTRSYG